MYWKLAGKALKFWPVHLDTRHHVFRVAAPVAFDPDQTLEQQLSAMEAQLAAGLRGETAEAVPDASTERKN